jgi:hypothetical protein
MGRCCRVLQLDKVYACAAKVGTGGQLTPMEQQMIKPRDPAALKRWKGHDYHVRAGGAGSIAPDRPPVLRLAVPAPAPASHTPSHTPWGGGGGTSWWWRWRWWWWCAGKVRAPADLRA